MVKLHIFLNIYACLFASAFRDDLESINNCNLIKLGECHRRPAGCVYSSSGLRNGEIIKFNGKFLRESNDVRIMFSGSNRKKRFTLKFTMDQKKIFLFEKFKQPRQLNTTSEKWFRHKSQYSVEILKNKDNYAVFIEGSQVSLFSIPIQRGDQTINTFFYYDNDVDILISAICYEKFAKDGSLGWDSIKINSTLDYKGGSNVPYIELLDGFKRNFMLSFVASLKNGENTNLENTNFESGVHEKIFAINILDHKHRIKLHLTVKFDGFGNQIEAENSEVLKYGGDLCIIGPGKTVRYALLNVNEPFKVDILNAGDGFEFFVNDKFVANFSRIISTRKFGDFSDKAYVDIYGQIEVHNFSYNYTDKELIFNPRWTAVKSECQENLRDKSLYKIPYFKMPFDFFTGKTITILGTSFDYSETFSIELFGNDGVLCYRMTSIFGQKFEEPSDARELPIFAQNSTFRIILRKSQTGVQMYLNNAFVLEYKPSSEYYYCGSLQYMQIYGDIKMHGICGDSETRNLPAYSSSENVAKTPVSDRDKYGMLVTDDGRLALNVQIFGSEGYWVVGAQTPSEPSLPYLWRLEKAPTTTLKTDQSQPSDQFFVTSALNNTFVLDIEYAIRANQEQLVILYEKKIIPDNKNQLFTWHEGGRLRSILHLDQNLVLALSSSTKNGLRYAIVIDKAEADSKAQTWRFVSSKIM